MEMCMAIDKLPLNDPTLSQRALVRRILRIRPDISPAQLVGILGGRALDSARDRPADRA
jgi:hypothetical protein